jgi:hypothetical protein
MRAPETLRHFGSGDLVAQALGGAMLARQRPGIGLGGEARDVILLTFTLGGQSFRALNGGAKASIRNVTALPEFVAAAAPAGFSGRRRLGIPQAEIFPCYSRNYSPVIPLLRSDELPCSGGIRCRFARRGTRFLSRFAPARLPGASRRAPIGYAAVVSMIFSFENNKVCHDYILVPKGTPNGAFASFRAFRARKCLKTLKTARAS